MYVGLCMYMSIYKDIYSNPGFGCNSEVDCKHIRISGLQDYTKPTLFNILFLNPVYGKLDIGGFYME